MKSQKKNNAPHPNPPRSRGGNRAAFTLAEVLITIGIIGVVAAMTIPSLIQNQQKQAWVNGLRMAHAKLQEGIRLAMADDQVSDFYATQLYAKCDLKEGFFKVEDGQKIETFDNQACYSELSKYFKTLGLRKAIDARYDEEGVYLAADTTGANCTRGVKNGTHKYYLNDKNKCWGGRNFELTFLNGMTIDMHMSDNGYYYGEIFVDVNGDKGPNTWGRDAFVFFILADGSIVPFYSQQHFKAKYPEEFTTKLYWGNTNMTAEQQVRLYNTCNKNTTGAGYHCSGRVLYEGKMNY